MILQPSLNFSAAQLRQDLDRITGLYHRQGYYLAAATVDSLMFSPDSTLVDIFISISEGKPAEVGQIRFSGNTAFTFEELLGAFDTQPGRSFDPAVLEQDIENLLRRYEQKGYPFSQAVVREISSTEDSSPFAITIDIDEGMLVRIDEIRVEGNKETRANVVVRETRLSAGELYNHEKVRTIPRRLNRLKIFSTVNEPELYVTPRGGGLLIKVQEGHANTFDGVAGYVPGGSDEPGFFTGLVNISMRNLFGTARKLNVHWLREDRHSQELALRYVEPWLFDLPLDLGGAFSQRQQDTTYVQRTIEFKADVVVTENLSLAVTYAHESVIPSATVAGPNVFNSSTITAGVEARYDSRDDPVSPTEGILYRSDYRIGRKRIFGLPEPTTLQTQSTVQKIGLDFEWFVATFPRQVGVLTLHGRELQAGQVETSDMYRFGGTNTIRGYRENQFLGSRVVWSNVEYRFHLARRSFFFGFFDTGYYLRPGDDAKGIPQAQGVKYGYGIGVRLDTALGNIGVSFALGEGDSFSQAKIHIGFMNDF